MLNKASTPGKPFEAPASRRYNNMAKKANAAFMKPLTPSDKLAEVVGSKPLPRTEVVKKLWAYIKKNNLQDKKNKRNINADAKLLPLFANKKQVTMFDLATIISKNIKK